MAVVAALQHFRYYSLRSHIILKTDNHSFKWLKTFRRLEGIFARCIETLAEFGYVIEHRSGRVHCNADEIPRPICKQCIGKTFTMPWIDEFERADKIVASLAVRALQFSSKYSNEDFRNL